MSGIRLSHNGKSHKFWLKLIVSHTRIFENFPIAHLCSAMAAPATPADAWTVVEEFAAATERREIDGSAILAPDANDHEAEIVENVTRASRDDMYAKHVTPHLRGHRDRSPLTRSTSAQVWARRPPAPRMST